MESPTDLASVCEVRENRDIQLVCLDDTDKIENRYIELVCLDDTDVKSIEEECGICLEVFQDFATLSSCKHKFCFKFKSQWMDK